VAQRERDWRHLLAHSGDASISLVAVADEMVAGVARAGRNRGTQSMYDSELYVLYVRREAQRLGLGRLLTKGVVENLKASGLESMIVWVLATNPARRFYEALGGIAVGTKNIVVGSAELEETAYGWPSLDALAARLRSGA
jgi:GNAT superfamily N-acetyltransferase